MSTKSPYNSPFRSKFLSPSSTIQQVDSPSKVKIKLLAEKWNNLENGIEKEKNERRTLLDEKLRQCEERISKERNSDDAKFKLLKEQLIKLQDSLAFEKQGRDLYDEKTGKDLKNVEESLEKLVEEEKNVKRSLDTKIGQQIDERFFSLNLSISRNNKGLDENKENKIKEIQTQMEVIQEQIELERKKREDSTLLISSQIETEISKFHDLLVIENKVREETQAKIFRMIEDIYNKLQNDIIAERRERETTTESLLKLLEDTCIKIDKNFKN